MPQQFELTQDDFNILKEIFNLPHRMGRGILFKQAWESFGDKYGFDWQSVEPISGNPKAFTAEPKDIKVLEQ